MRAVTAEESVALALNGTDWLSVELAGRSKELAAARTRIRALEAELDRGPGSNLASTAAPENELRRDIHALPTSSTRRAALLRSSGL